MAKEAKMSLKEYWAQIIKACFLDKKDPIKEWRRVFGMVEKAQKKLNSLPIDKMHVKGPDVDLWVHLGRDRRWMGGSGRNIPSFELFTSPDWRGTEGWIRFSEPLYRYGNLITGIELWFKNGRVVKCKAKQNEKVLKQMIATQNADKVGEFSLTDKRFSRITKFMAETLFDENVGGKYGNTHIALGNAYHDCFADDPSTLEPEDWEELGFNSSSVHTDIVSTTPRTVTAYMRDGTTQVIYKDGLFTFL
jgi:aminopeptidase